MYGLNLTQAKEIANGALAKAREMGCKPMTVATASLWEAQKADGSQRDGRTIKLFFYAAIHAQRDGSP
jgi:hypothetical protein